MYNNIIASASEGPKVKYVNVDLNLTFKPKKGVIEAWDFEAKEKREFKSIDIIPISDLRFTVEAGEPVAGERVVAGLYRSAKQTITVFKNGKVMAKGLWADIKEPHNLRWVKVLHCIVMDNGKPRPARFDIKGLAHGMWADIKESGTDGVITLSVSDEASYKYKGKSFYLLSKASQADLTTDQEVFANDFAMQVKESYESEDASYKYYRDKDKESDPVSIEPVGDVVDTDDEEIIDIDF